MEQDVSIKQIKQSCSHKAPVKNFHQALSDFSKEKYIHESMLILKVYRPHAWMETAMWKKKKVYIHYHKV